ncbi:hypothetical protein EMCRGX_G031650 [Ephydatia muelleri]
MANTHLDICGKDSGTIWTAKPVARPKDGLLLSISNTKVGLTSQGKHMQFVRVAFGCHGNWFVGGDQQGNIYHFNIAANRFKLIYRSGLSSTALVCCSHRPNEILAAFSDYTIRCLDIDTGDMVATLRGHDASIKSLSLDTSGRLLLAVSSKDSVLWDLNSFSRFKTLNGGQEIGVQDVFFLPFSDTIVTCFKDDSIHSWETDTLEYKYLLPTTPGPSPHYRAFAASQDGKVLVGGGRSSLLHVWSTEARSLTRVIQLPSKVRHVRQLFFLVEPCDAGASEILGVLAQDGILRLINIHTCKLIFQMGSSDQMLGFVCTSPDGRSVIAVTERGDLQVFDVSSMHQPPSAPVTKMLEDEERTPSTTPPVSKLATSHVEPTSVPRKTKLVPRPFSDPPDGSKEEDKGPPSLDPEKLKSILKTYGEYPAKYRAFIWRCLLHLPGNHAAYNTLLGKGTHPAYAKLHQQYPIKSRKLLRVLQRALSALAHWSSIFGETDYLPGMVFPFVKLFQNNQLVCFELLASLLTNWCSHWFEYFPNPPLNVLAMVENLLAHHDAHLLEHLITHNITTHHYAWPLLETMFSEVLSRDEWLRAWDNVVSNHPSFLLFLVLGYLVAARHTLLQCTTPEDFEYFFHHQNTVDINAVIREAYHLCDITPKQLHPNQLLEPFVPLTQGTYPVFNKYPKFIVDYQVRERERIRLEEVEYLRQRQSALELERLTEKRRHEEEAWHRQQELLLEAEGQRRKLLELEEQKLSDQRARLQAMRRELRVKELKVLDAARQRFLEHQQSTKEAEVRRLDDEIRKKVVRRDVETKALLEDIELRALELEARKTALEQDLERTQHETVYRLRADHEAEVHRMELERDVLDGEVDGAGEEEKEGVADADARLARVQAHEAATRALREAGARREERSRGERGRCEEVVEREEGNLTRQEECQRLTDELVRAEDAEARERTPLSVEPLTTSTEQSKTEDSNMSHLSNETVETPGESALNWSRRRDKLDRSHEGLFSRVLDLRQRIASNMARKTSENPLRNPYSNHPCDTPT